MHLHSLGGAWGKKMREMTFEAYGWFRVSLNGFRASGPFYVGCKAAAYYK